MARSIKDWSPRERDVLPDSLEEFMLAYVAAALWSSMDESDPDTGGNPLDANYDIDDINSGTLRKMEEDGRDFLKNNWDDIAERLSDAGHDFWLTRNRTGAGFSDGDWPEAAATRLEENSQAYGEYYLYIGDDGKIYGHG